MVLNVFLALGGIALLFYALNRYQKPLTDTLDGVNEVGGKIENTLFPEPGDENVTCDQKCRDEKGALGNTFDYFFGDRSLRAAAAAATAAAVPPQVALNTGLMNNKGGRRFGK